MTAGGGGGGGGGDTGAPGRGSGDRDGDSGNTSGRLRGSVMLEGGSDGDGGEPSSPEGKNPTNDFLWCSQVTSRGNDLLPDTSRTFLQSAELWVPLLR